MARPAYRTAGYKRGRKALLADSPICAHCHKNVATEADHDPPLSLHEHVPGSGCCVLLPSCFDCARKQGGVLGGGGGKVLSGAVPAEPEPVPMECFDVEWLEDLLDVPKDATWPRFMSAPHPDAVGSLGMEVEAFSLAFHGQPMRWWQKLAVRRLLEYDRDGHLCWDTALLTMARQCGKTYLLGDLCAWRLGAASFFMGAQQTVLSTGKDVSVCLEMMRPHLIDALGNKLRYHVRQVNGQHTIELLADSSRWLVRAKDAVYGITVSLATVDEAWAVAVSIVDDGLEPTTVEALDSQILMTSTAHRKATALMIGRRARALDNLSNGEGPLIMEWSAPPDADLDDRKAWRMASPHWSAKRERTISKRLEGALAGESDDADEPDPLASFKSQWLNIWPARRLKNTKGVELVDLETWTALAGEVHDDPERIYVGVEDHAGFGAAIAAVVIQEDGTYGLDGWTVPTWTDALASLRKLYRDHEVVKLHVGATLLLRLAPGMRATPATSTLTRSTLPAMRELITGNEIVHCSDEITDQIEQVRVTEAIGGLVPVPGIRSDLLRAASWALASASKPKKTLSVH